MNADIGAFDRRITLQQPVHTQDATGGRVPGWSTVATVWARRLSAKGREFNAGGVELASVEEGFQIRYGAAWAGLDATWRVLYNGRTYDLLAVDEMGRRERFTLMCKAGTNRG